MDVILLMLDTALIIFLCYWAGRNDAAGSSGATHGLFAYRGEPASLKQPSRKTPRPGRQW
jgi:hypothetical protein